MNLSSKPGASSPTLPRTQQYAMGIDISLSRPRQPKSRISAESGHFTLAEMKAAEPAPSHGTSRGSRMMVAH